MAAIIEWLDILCSAEDGVEAFWNSSQLWHTQTPTFNRCFQRVASIWAPAVFLLLLTPMHLFSLYNNNRRKNFQPPKTLHFTSVLRYVIVLVLVAVNLARSTSDSTLLGPVLNVFTFALFSYHLHQHRVYSDRPSCTFASFFSLFCIILNTPALYMHVFFESGESDYSENQLFIVHFVALVVLFILSFFVDSSKTTSNDSPTECPEPYVSLLSRLTFSWVSPLISTGYHKTLSLDDLWELNPTERTEYVAARLETNWRREYGQGEKTPPDEGHFWSDLKRILRTWRVLIRTFGWTYALATMLQLALALVAFVHPQLLKVFLRFISTTESTEPTWHGYLLALLFFLTATLNNLLTTQYSRLKDAATQGTNSALTALIYRKSLNMGCTARKKTNSGELISLLTSDVHALCDLVVNVNTLWITPLEIAIAMYCLWLELGHSDLVALLVIVAMIPLNMWIRNVQRNLHKEQRAKRKARIKMTTELLGGIRVVKLYGWEVPFMRQIGRIRAEELDQVRLGNYINQLSHFIWSAAPLLVSLATLSVYLLNAEQSTLDASKVFVSLSLFELLKTPITTLTSLVNRLDKLTLSLKKVVQFFNAEEVSYVEHKEDEQCAVRIENGSFAWDKAQTPVLSGVNLKIHKGSLVAVVGHVGAGKSSLLSAILGEMECLSGTVNIAPDETLAYVAQQAWIQNTTLVKNVLFGSQLDQVRYDSILEMVALAPDIAILPAGDKTEIGEKGINLSGGQKQRVALARAVYSAASLFILDDPLASVDSHVARSIFHQVLSSSTGYLQEKTRLLVTNNIALLPEVDQVILLESGQIIDNGTYTELLGRSKRFAALVAQHKNDSVGFTPSDDSKESSDDLPRPEQVPRPSTDSTAKVDKASKGQLIEPEKTKSTRVPLAVYLHYLRSMTFTGIATFCLCYLTMRLCSTGSRLWLALWTSDNVNQSAPKQSLRSYGALGLAESLFYCLGSFTLARSCLKSSATIHQNLLEHLLRLPMSFYDTTPIGRIINLFSANMSSIDSSLPALINGIVLCFLVVISNFLLVGIQIPHFFAVIIPVLLIYFSLQHYQSITRRQLNRLSYIVQSPIFSQFHESFAGLSTIRASGAGNRFITENAQMIDSQARCSLHCQLAQKWMSIRMDAISSLISLAVTLLVVTRRDQLGGQPGLAALLLNHSLDLKVLQYLVSMVMWFDSAIASVERVEDYQKKEPEAVWQREDAVSMPDGWPQRGEIEFVDYSVRYRAGLELVLKNVNLKIEAGEKVGVVGRTGTGKTTISLALFRILEAATGQIRIDGIDIAKVGLHELRHRLAIIPQDPVLFSGTIRSNLDPFGVYRDELLLEALTQCHMRAFVDATERGLEHPVAENGSNLSLGQRQLLCLGRALLRRAKILLMDEVSAAVDLETDALIQKTIRVEFSSCTVITIAQRVHTILDSDRVLVLDGGSVQEFDSPQRLLANAESMFYSLAKDANIL